MRTCVSRKTLLTGRTTRTRGSCETRQARPLSTRSTNLTLRAGSTDRSCVSASANHDGTRSTCLSDGALRPAGTLGTDLTRRAAQGITLLADRTGWALRALGTGFAHGARGTDEIGTIVCDLIWLWGCASRGKHRD